MSDKSGPKIPKSLKPLSASWKDASWQGYTPFELVMWTHLLSKRAGHRDPTETDKIAKDLFDAHSYFNMLASHAKQAGVDVSTQKNPLDAGDTPMTDYAMLIDSAFETLRTTILPKEKREDLLDAIGILIEDMAWQLDRAEQAAGPAVQAKLDALRNPPQDPPANENTKKPGKERKGPKAPGA